MPYSVSTSAWRPHVRAAVAEINDRFKPSSVGTYPGHQPTMSLAADFMCNKATGDAICAYAVANMSRLGIDYVIWYRQMYRSYVKNGVPAGKPAPYTGTPNPHTDHVHISWKTSPGTGGPVVNSTIGNDNGRIDVGDIPGVEQAQQIAEIYGILKSGLNWATNKQNWINLLLILVGAWLILIALWRIAGTEVINTVKAVAS